MLPLPYRLPSWEIPLVLKSGKRRQSPNFQVAIRVGDQKTPRFAIVVPGRLDKRAVVRNRNKRLVRESLVHLLPEVPSGWDAVVLVKRSVYALKQMDVEKEIRGLFTS